MSFPRYPKYRDSGVEWLGKVPEHWEVMRLRRCASSVQTGGTPSTEPPSTNLDQGLVWYTPGDFGDSLRLTTSARKISPGVVATGEAKFFPPRSVLIVSIGATLGKVGFAEEASSANQQINAVIPNKRIDAYFLAYSLLVKAEVMRFLSNASTIGIMNQEKTKDIWIVVPPHGEQGNISAFLDRETAKIDALVVEQRRLMELLKEKRQAVISHAVTNGLNPDAPMKPSGIEWPREVPAEWTVKRIKHLIAGSDGIQMGPFGGMLLDLDSEETGFKVYGQENTISGDFSLGHRWISQDRFTTMSNYHVHIGDLLLTRKGSLGNARLIQSLPQPGIVDSDTIRVRVNESLIMKTFLALLLHEARYVSEQIALTKRGAILSGLNSESIANISIIVPPLSQQLDLMVFLADQTAKFDTLTAEAQRAIDLLQERRTALISAAVTGQIDVRDAIAA
jgi:type I restriction enzyme, S subunit